MSRGIEELNRHEMRSIVQEIIDKKRGISRKPWVDIIADYDLNYSPDNFTKLAYGVMFAKDSGMRFDEDEQAQIDKAFTERQKLYDIQRQVRKDLREMSRTELICESISKAIKDLPEIKLSHINYQTNRSKKKDLVVGIGDFHYGAEYEVTGLYGESINKYNSSVFEYRMSLLESEIIKITDKERPNQITIMIAGDMLDGILRTSQLQRLEYGVVESAIRLGEMMANWIVDLANTVNIPVRIYAVRGNHGEIRPLGTKSGQFPEENMERIVMHYLFARFEHLKDAIITQNDAPMMQIIDVCGYQFLLTHGQGTDIESLARDSVNLYQKPIDFFMVGHLHKGQAFSSGIMPESNIYVERVPSICGIDPYAQFKGYGALPGATIILMEEGYGRRCIYPIILK